jgi:hypothetical protein
VKGADCLLAITPKIGEATDVATALAKSSSPSAVGAQPSSSSIPAKQAGRITSSARPKADARYLLKYFGAR